MVLNPHPVYPSVGRYVLRLHRDALGQANLLAGRIEHVTSGDSVDFASGSQLLDWLRRHVAQAMPGTSCAPSDPQELP